MVDSGKNIRRRWDGQMIKLKVIVGSTRPTRAADKVVPWIMRRILDHGSFEPELLDLREWELPPFQEHLGSIGDFSDPTYSDPIIREWNRKIREAEAFLIITPEYLHGMPGLLKNALDSVFASFAFRNKPAAALSYSSGIAGGSRAIENLAHVAVEAELILLRNTVIIPFVDAAFNETGSPSNLMTEAATTVMLDDLVWWSNVLTHARSDGQLLPGSARVRALLAEQKSE